MGCVRGTSATKGVLLLCKRRGEAAVGGKLAP